MALLVGAIRSTAEIGARIRCSSWKALNRRLIGRGRCAGHLPGAAHCGGWRGRAGQCRSYTALSEWRPVAMEGALPLGMMEARTFSVMRFKLAEGDRMDCSQMVLSRRRTRLGICSASSGFTNCCGRESLQQKWLVRRSSSARRTTSPP